MSKGLEALKELKGVLAYFGAHTEKAIESCNTIEKELKRLEEIDNVMFLNNKKLKALEIIKKKRVNVGLIKICDDYEEYNRIKLPKENKLLTETEFNLLKEVML